jgi:hypothetical protein
MAWSEEEVKQIKYLCGFLIVLCLLLVWCIYNNTYSNVQSKRYYENMTNWQGRLPGVKLALSSKENMNDREQTIQNRHPLNPSQMKQNITGLRWESMSVGQGDSMTSNIGELPDNSLKEFKRKNEVINGDELAPWRPSQKINDNYSSHSNDILTKTDYRKIYYGDNNSGNTTI